MTSIRRQRPVSRVTIDGIETAVTEIHTSHGTDQPVGLGNLVLPLPVPSQIEAGAPVRIEAGYGDDFFDNPIFVGTVAPLTKEAAARLTSGRVGCVGHNHRLTYPLVRDVAYGGGAGTTPALLVSTARHLGDQTISYYAIDAPEGTHFDATWTPAVDSSFIRLTGKYHGANNQTQNVEGLRLTHFSRIEIRQGGVARGYAIFPSNTDDDEADYNVVEEFGDVGVWTDFDLTIAATLVADGSSATARFISGYPPGGDVRDDFEVQQVRRSTAGKMTARSVIRGLCKKAGMGGASGISYVVDEIESYSGVVIELGGNGLVDNGQIRFPAGEQPIRSIQRIAELFRYKVFDRPDGVCCVRGVRGSPDPAASAMTLTEGIDLFNVQRDEDPHGVINYWRVLGASGADQDGRRFQYLSEPDIEAIPDNPAVLSPDGWNYGPVSDSLLVSDTLCLYAGNLHEADFSDIPIVLEWQTWGRSIQPGRVVTADAPSVDYTGPLWLTGIRHDIDRAGYVTSMTGWAGSGSPIAEAPDPDEDEDDIEPGDPQDAGSWRPYLPRAVA